MAPACRRPGSVSLAHVPSSKTSSRPASYSTLDPLAELKPPDVGASNTPTSQSESSVYSYPIGASNTPCRIAVSVQPPSLEPDATEQVRAAGIALQETKSIEDSKSQGSQVSDGGGQQWIIGATDDEGIDVSLKEGQVNGDPALQITTSNDEKVWNAVELEAGNVGNATPEDATEDPGKGTVSNVVVWFGPTDPEVSLLFLLRATMVDSQ